METSVGYANCVKNVFASPVKMNFPLNRKNLLRNEQTLSIILNPILDAVWHTGKQIRGHKHCLPSKEGLKIYQGYLFRLK